MPPSSPRHAIDIDDEGPELFGDDKAVEFLRRPLRQRIWDAIASRRYMIVSGLLPVLVLGYFGYGLVMDAREVAAARSLSTTEGVAYASVPDREVLLKSTVTTAQGRAVLQKVRIASQPSRCYRRCGGQPSLSSRKPWTLRYGPASISVPPSTAGRRQPEIGAADALIIAGGSKALYEYGTAEVLASDGPPVIDATSDGEDNLATTARVMINAIATSDPGTRSHLHGLTIGTLQESWKFDRTAWDKSASTTALLKTLDRLPNATYVTLTKDERSVIFTVHGATEARGRCSAVLRQLAGQASTIDVQVLTDDHGLRPCR